MASKNPTQKVPRREFLAACGLAAAVTALPSPAAVSPQRAAPQRRKDRHGIAEPPVEAMAALRGYYFAEVARVAAELRPRFESGELHGWRDEDSARMEDEDREGEWVPPSWRVEDECGERFVRGSMTRAYVVLAVSPSECETFDGAVTDPRYHAANAMAHDVIRFVRAQGWSVQEAGEKSPSAEPESDRYEGSGRFRGWSRRHGRRVS